MKGSCNSPLYYIIYTNDMQTTNDNTHIIKFADDTAIIGLIHDDTDTQRYNDCINYVHNYCNESFLSLNVNKTKEMYFYWKNHIANPQPVKLGGKNVEIVNTFCYLGLTLDNKLTFSEHVKICCKTANSRLALLRKLRKENINSKVLYIFYNSNVLSVVTFGLTIFFGHLNLKDSNSLKRIVNRARKIINIEIPSLDCVYRKLVKKKANKIVKYSNHPLHHKYAVLPSGRRYRSIRCNSVKYSKAFLPTSIKLLNSWGNK